MERDIRQTPLYQEIEEYFRKALESAFDRISGAANPAPSPDGRTIAFTGSRMEKLEGSPSSRVCLVNVDTGTVQEATGGPNSDRMPRWSPDGSRLAFLSDRTDKGTFQLYILESGRFGEALRTPAVEGTAEYLSWSPDGRRILMGVAGQGADKAGVQGSGTTSTDEEELPPWMPTVDRGATENQWRRLYVYEVDSGESHVISREGLNVWEAVWAGPACIAGIVSEAPTEDAWYDAPLALIDLSSGKERVVCRSEWQLGLPAASPSGRRLAAVEALCSDRAVVAGDLLVGDQDSLTRRDTRGVDVTHLVWRDEDHLLYSGIRGLRTVVGEYDTDSGESRELWSSGGACGWFYPEAWPITGGGFVTVADSFDSYPEVTLVRDGDARAVTSLAHDGVEYLKGLGGGIEEVTWMAPDGLEIQGYLVTPEGRGPHPLIVNVHGGPVGAWRNRWMASPRLLASRGYAILFANPRGSSGRGQAFARMVYGDPGGAETGDTLSGIDALVERGIVDPQRIGVMGGSHGGFMTTWLITQTNRFAAAVAISPVTDWYSQHHTSNIGEFDRLFLQDDLHSPGGKYFERSPVMFAEKVRTPTLQTAGSVDRCTPPTQAQEFHQALLEHGRESVLVTYPQEGHGVGQFPAIIDQTTRIVDWFERHMPAQKA